MADENTTETVEEIIDAVVTDTPADVAAADIDEKPALGSKAKMEQARKVADQRKADRDIGRQAAESAFMKKLKDMGFENLDQVATVQKANKPAPSDDAELRKEYQAMANENRGLKSRITTLEKQLQAAVQKQSAYESEMEIRQLAYEADVDPEYIDAATTALQRSYQRLDAKAAKEFDPGKWLKEDLKSRKPGIFRQALSNMTERKIEEKPVNTGAPGSAPRAQTNAAETEQPVLKNALKMTKKELDEAMAAKGFINPARHVS